VRLSKINLLVALPIVLSLLPSEGGALTLSEAHLILVKSDPEILRSEVGAEIAQTRQERAVSELFPKISTTLSTSRTSREQYGQKERYQGEDYSIIISQPIYNEPLWAEPDRLSAIVRQREALAEGTRQKRRSELVSAYAQWIEAEVRQQLIQRRLVAVGKRYEQVERLFEKQRLVSRRF